MRIRVSYIYIQEYMDNDLKKFIFYLLCQHGRLGIN